MSLLRRLRAIAFAVSVLAASTASAKLNGIVSQGCGGCHGGGTEIPITVTLDPENPMPGAMTTLTVRISSFNGNNAGGMYLRTNDKGTFSVISGQSTKLVSAVEVIHSAPKSGSGGAVTFQVQWKAPSTPGGVNFDVWGVSANGNNASSGDAAGHGFFTTAYGCTPITYYKDDDGDGIGNTERGIAKDCSLPFGYSASDFDCDENDGNVFPGHPEVCNGKDDNCNNMVDEGLGSAMYYEDSDGDGYGVSGGTTRIGCAPGKGFADNTRDCNDDNAAIHPDAGEICNGLDDNCDSRIDEGARLICGVGMCRRYGISCQSSLCVPGDPEPEECNGLDDDCDNEIDEGPNLCPTGQECVKARCVPAGTVPLADGGVAPADAGVGAGTQPSSCSASSGWMWMALGTLAVLLKQRRFVERRR